MNDNLTILEEKRLQEIDSILDYSVSFLEKGYLSNPDSFEIVKIDEEIENNLNFSRDIRIIHIQRFVYEEDENILDKLSNVYTALYGNNSSFFFLLESNGKKCDFYLGVKDRENIAQAFTTLKSSLNGNFPGMVFDEEIETEKCEHIMENLLSKDILEISAVTGVPSLKYDDKEKFIQGIEKLIDGMEGREFSALFLADPVKYNEIKEVKKAYESIYSQLTPFSTSNITLTQGEAKSFTQGMGESFTKSFTETLSKTETVGKSDSLGHSTNESTSSGINVIFGNFGKNKGSGTSYNSTTNRSVADSTGESYSESKNTQKNNSNTDTTSSSRTLQLTQKNRTIENILKKLDDNLERMEIAEGNGMWNVGTYFMSKNPQDSVVAANIYNGLIRGKDSGIEKNGVYSFKEEYEMEIIKDHLFNFSNPVIRVKNKHINIDTTMGSLVTNDELPLKINLPKKSTAGLEVVTVATFGRNAVENINSKNIQIGKIYHLGKPTKVDSYLDIESLTSHTFITGSTGSGKSNAVYTLISELYKKEIKFMVIEPAKGEYKNIFGGFKDVEIYGTNPKITNILKINPFSFNSEIHILEHIDRIIEIFNACWPMYAAMPAILKEAVELSYELKGWDLKRSINLFGKAVYPNFKDLKNSLINIIKNSLYSEELKSTYMGALVTRVNSLSNGLIGSIFSDDELSEIELFEENVIVDISRIPSMETKALIMGILFLKLHEFRISEGVEENCSLRHVTVLEEAHNLLRKSSVVQSTETSNPQGKSVEMITNAIAEMRTYGEGFIIADQAPGLLDEAVIRNTNTKICLRLPSMDDREIVGKSMNLTEDQIGELSKLETGVAAIYQNNWNEATLIKFNYMNNKSKYIYNPHNETDISQKEILKFLMGERLPESERLLEDNKKIKIREFLLKKGIESEILNNKEKDALIFNIIEGEKILRILDLSEFNNIEEWSKALEIIFKNLYNLEEKSFLRLELANALIREKAQENEGYREFYKEWNKAVVEGAKKW